MVVQVNSMRRMELDPLILRWKKTTRALKIHEQHYGKYITDILERRTDANWRFLRTRWKQRRSSAWWTS